MNARPTALLASLLVTGGVAILFFRRRASGKSGDVVSDVLDAATVIAVNARSFLTGEEGLSLTAYQDVAGYWTIGYGHLIKPGERFYPYGDVREITAAEADELYNADTAIAKRAVEQYVKVPLKDSQRAALISFVYNVGVGAFQSSTLLKKLNAGDFTGAADELLRWNKAGGVVVAGLSNRRARERDLFLS